MRHRVSHRKLGRVTEHRIAMLRNQAEALHPPRAASRPPCRRRRSCGRSSSGSSRSPSAASPRASANGKSLHARRLVLRDIQDRDVVSKLFDTIAPRFEARPGGYTRILRLGFRRGDSAEVAQIELVGSEFDPNAEAEKAEAAAKAKPKGVGGRLRAAAERLRGKKKPEGAEEGADESPENKAKPKRQLKSDKSGRATTKGKASAPRAPRKSGGA